MPKPFANAQPINPALMDGDWLLGIQTGNNTGDSGLPQMKYIKLSQLADWVRTTYGQMWRYRGAFSASLPSDPQTNDYFLATATFTVGANTYTENHLYAYNGSSWDDVSDVLTQYASQSQVTDIDDRLTVVEVKVDAMGDGIVYKGVVATYADLAGIVDPQTGWEYYVTGDAAFYVYNGSSWDQIDNAVVQTITSGDISHAPSADAVYNAFEDEATARDAADNNLQSQIVNLNTDVENIEALIGEEAEVTNTDPSTGTLLAQSRLIHHANLLPNGEFGRVGARAVAWGQQVPSYTTQTIDGITLTQNNDGSVTISKTGTPTTGADFNATLTGSFTSVNHKILFVFSPSQVVGITSYPIYATYYADAGGIGTSGIVDSYSSNSRYLNRFRISVDLTADLSSPKTFRPMLFDLTAMGLSSLTVSQFRALFPASYYPHDEGHIYDLNPSGFKVVGTNIYDQKWKVGAIYSSSGAEVAGNNFISENYIPVSPSLTYYLKCVDSHYGGIQFYYYDVGKNYISFQSYIGNGNTFTTPSNCAFVRFQSYLVSSGYYNDIQICLDSLPSSVKTVYHPYDGHTVDTPQIADGHYVNENVYDYVENVTEDGVIKGKKHSVVGSYTFTGNETWTDSGSAKQSDCIQSLVKPVANTTDIANLLAPNLPTVSSYSLYSGSNTTGIAVHSSGAIRVGASDVSSLTGKTIYFELATEVVSDCEPLRSFGISDYSTVEPITPQEQLANRIDVPFSVVTKSANTLIQQIRQNTSNIATNTARLDNHEARIENLEQKAGGYSVVNYRGSNAVPTGKAEYGLVESIVGKSRAWNQLFDISSQTAYNDGSLMIIVDTTTMTINGTSTSVVYKSMPSTFKFISGHKYLFYMEGFSNDCYLSDQSGLDVFNDIKQTSVLTANASGGDIRITVPSGRTFSNVSLKLVVRDLNLIFPEGVPSTVAECVAKCPDILKYDDYGYSLVDTTVEGVVSVKFNLWDEEWESGDINIVNGEKRADSSRCRSKNFIDVEPLTTYYTKTEYLNTTICCYDADGNWVSSDYESGYFSGQNATFTTPSWCHKIMLYYNGATYNHDICINVSGSLNGTYKPYREPSTLSLPSPVTLRSAGSGVNEVADTIDPESGVPTTRIGRKNLGDLSWTFSSPHGFYAYISDAKSDMTRYDVLTSDSYIPYNNKYLSALPDYCMNMDSGYIGICDPRFDNPSDFTTNVQNKYVNYPLATPTTEASIGTSNPMIQTEGGGTIRTIQTQTPVIDNCMDVGYLVL